MSRPRRTPAVPPTPLEREVAFLVREGYVSPAPGGEYTLTPDGRDWLLWSLWQALGCPGMPTETETEDAKS